MTPRTEVAGGGGGTLASMTAFARASAMIEDGSLVWEVKTVNNKGLDLRLRLPPGFDAQEAACRGLIGAVVTRGSVQATLSLARTAAAPQVRINAALLGALITALERAVPPGARVDPVSLDGLLGVRGVVEIVDHADGADERATLGMAALDLLGVALADLRVARNTEGEALGALLLDHLGAIAILTEAAEAAPGRTAAAIAAKLAASIEAVITATPKLDPDRLHQEAMLLATRADIREELDRLTIHIRSARALLRAAGPIGRRLDFLAQELAREANTLCAKSNDAALTAIGLDLRNRIEQFREQVQNLE